MASLQRRPEERRRGPFEKENPRQSGVPKASSLYDVAVRLIEEERDRRRDQRHRKSPDHHHHPDHHDFHHRYNSKSNNNSDNHDNTPKDVSRARTFHDDYKALKPNAVAMDAYCWTSAERYADYDRDYTLYRDGSHRGWGRRQQYSPTAVLDKDRRWSGRHSYWNQHERWGASHSTRKRFREEKEGTYISHHDLKRGTSNRMRASPHANRIPVEINLAKASESSRFAISIVPTSKTNGNNELEHSANSQQQEELQLVLHD